MKTPSDPLADALRGALDEEERSRDEDAVVARAIEGAMRAAETSDVARLRWLRRSRRARVLRIAMPIAAAFVVSVAMARIVFFDAHRAPQAPPAPQAGPRDPGVGAPEMSSAPAPQTTPSFAIDDLPSAKPPPPPPQTALAPPPSLSAEKGASERGAPEQTAAELFREANAARRTGEIPKALTVYRALIQRFPKAPESLASRVSLGRLLLDRQGDPGGALEQFEAYLAASSGDQTLAEEARVGKALALQRLGRRAEEQRAWEELVRVHTSSVHVAHARERLRALAGASGGEATSP